MKYLQQSGPDFLKRLLFPILGTVLLLALPALLLSQAELRPPTNPFGEKGELTQFTLDTTRYPAMHPQIASSTQAPISWQSLYTNTFPANDLGSMTSSSRNPALPNERWGIGNITGTAYAPFSVWVAGARSVVTMGSGETYTDSMDAWLIYGPFDGSTIWNAALEFDYFNRTHPGDNLIVGYSTDGINFTGFRTSGLMNDWSHGQMEWETGRRAQLWVAFGFQSNSDGQVEQGAWIDNLNLMVNYGTRNYLPIAVRNWPLTPTPTPTPTPRPGYREDFSNVNSGWPRAVYNRGTNPDGAVLDVNYDNNEYRMKILLDTNRLNNRRMGVLPAPYTNPYSNYDIEVDHRFAYASDQVVEPTDGKGGLIFAANSNYTTIFVVEWNYQGNCAVTRYDGVSRPTSVYTNPLVSTAIIGWQSCIAQGYQAGYNKNNHFLVEVRDNRATIYIVANNTKTQLTTFTDSFLQTNHYVGLVNGSFEWTPVDGRFDNFWVLSAP